MQTDTLIIGGGLAGLSLAARLQAAGGDYLLVEARERFGGRIHTRELAGLASDLGPAWFWPGQPRMAALAESFGLGVFEQFASGEVLMEDPNGVVQRGMGYASMAGSYRITGGLGRIIDALVDQIPAERRRTGIKAMSLTQGEPIRIGLEAGEEQLEIKASQVVLALPPRVAVSAISFLPALADVTYTAATSVPTWMAGQAKIVAVYDRPYWREDGLSGDVMSRHGPMVEIHDASPAEHGPYALFGFVGVPPDVRLARRDAVLEAARAQLVRVFGDALAHPLALELMDWAHEPFTSTAADHQPLGYHPDYGLPRALADVWNGRVIFGSTETGLQFGGYLEGALEAADNVLAELERMGAPRRSHA